MPAAKSLFNKQMLIGAISESNETIRPKIFQVMDTLLAYVQAEEPMPIVHVFDIDEDVIEYAIYLERFMRSCKPEDLHDELRPINVLRPHGPTAYRPILQHVGTDDRKKPTMAQAQSADSNPSDQGAQGVVQTYDQAMKLERRLMAANNRKVRAESCNDIPKTDEERLIRVKELIAAMVNYDDIIDNRVDTNHSPLTTQSGDPGNGHSPQTSVTRDSTHVLRVKHTTQDQLQVTAWKIQRYTEDAQQGFIDLPSQRGKKIEYKEYATYMDRHKAVVTALKSSKALVVDQMAWDATRRLVAAPEKENQRKQTNKKGNAKKGDLIRVGIQARKLMSGESSPTPATPAMTAGRPSPNAGNSVAATQVPVTTAAAGGAMTSGSYMVDDKSHNSIMAGENMTMAADVTTVANPMYSAMIAADPVTTTAGTPITRYQSTSSDESSQNAYAANSQLAADLQAQAVAGVYDEPMDMLPSVQPQPSYTPNNDFTFDLNNGFYSGFFQ